MRARAVAVWAACAAVLALALTRRFEGFGLFDLFRRVAPPPDDQQPDATTTTAPPPTAKVTPRTAPRPKAKQRSLPPECKIWGDVYGANQTKPGGVRRDNVRATYHFYAPTYETASLACSDLFWAWGKGFEKRLLKYPWTAYCATLPWDRAGDCGRCLRVTNRRTGASIIVRAVDRGGCSDKDGTGLDLDPCAFNAIDTDKQGYRDGNMRVDIEEVDCMD